VTKTTRPRRRLPTGVRADESSRALLIRFCRWAYAHPDLTDGEEAFVDRFLRETAPMFGRPVGAGQQPPRAPDAAPRAQGGAQVVETEAMPPGGDSGLPGGDGGDVGVGQFIGAIFDRLTRK
jgi:hypothetical protein